MKVSLQQKSYQHLMYAMSSHVRRVRWHSGARARVRGYSLSIAADDAFPRFLSLRGSKLQQVSRSVPIEGSRKETRMGRLESAGLPEC